MQKHNYKMQIDRKIICKIYGNSYAQLEHEVSGNSSLKRN